VKVTDAASGRGLCDGSLDWMVVLNRAARFRVDYANQRIYVEGQRQPEDKVPAVETDGQNDRIARYPGEVPRWRKLIEGPRA